KSAHYDDSFAESQFYADRSLPVKLYKNSLGMGREILCSQIFLVGRGERPRREVTVTSFRGAQVHYRGPELRQDDARVLEFLVHAVRGKTATAAIHFVPLQFVEHMGWDAHKTSVEKLRGCIERMQESVLKIARGRASVSAQLVGEFAVHEDGTWTVNLHRSIVEIFEGGCTYLPLEEQ